MQEQGATMLARLGFAARGLVYILVGWFALDAARQGSRPGDNQAAMASLVDEPFGRVLLALIALGLAGYALWRLSEAAFDPERRGTDMKGTFERVGFAISGIAHVFLAIYAAGLVVRPTTPVALAPGDESARDWTAWLMEQPGGAWAVGLVGLLMFVVSAAQAVKAYKAEFVLDLQAGTPAPAYVRVIGRLGYAARTIVFLLVGWFFTLAAYHSDASEAGGMARALRFVQRQDYGAPMLATVAAGLFLFGLYSLIEARFRRVRVVLEG